ncbi:hypothetical protein [Hymenobacter sediminicola]|uniref:Uncharacterized protein n=1 Tax=Hymenobacter sediminicola TaxID=2761579 RepID=A0A7G7W9X3_9BACT|nr:hypothetical protein [Hymenobacter sediminicola]QNH63166.1 hypothetical protein H4317_04985 [Hymenobacter sediminicola]
MITIDQSQFLTNLRSTQAYCQHQLEQKEKVEWTGLRSTINPVCKDGEWFAHMPGPIDEKPIPWAEWNKKSDPYLHDSFVTLFCRQLEFKNTVSGKLSYSDVFRGKILVVEHGQNIPDGATEPETSGFFDEWDLPPIDTWFYNTYSEPNGGILFAWIPEKFVELTDKAIDIQFLNILHWFEKPSSWNESVII